MQTLATEVVELLVIVAFSNLNASYRSMGKVSGGQEG